MFRAQADWTFILPSNFLLRKSCAKCREKMSPQTYQTSQHVVPRGGNFLGK
jgi:hypothetical protein